MYNNMTGQQQLKHRAKPMCGGNCHHECLTGNVCGPRGTRPFVEALRPEVDVRMRLEFRNAWCGPGTTLGIPRIPGHAQTAQVMPARVGVASLGASLGTSCSEQVQNNHD